METNELAKLGELEKQIDDLRRRSDAVLARHQKGMLITTIIGAVVLVAVILYLSWIARTVRDIIEPSSLATIMRQRIQENIPGAVDSVKELLKENAPVLANETEARIMQALPEMRATAQKATDQLVQKAVATAETQAAKSMDRFLKEHKKELEEAVSAARSAESREYTEKLLEIYSKEYLLPTFDMVLEDTVGADLDKLMSLASAALSSLRDQLLVLQKGENLTKEQELQRQLVRLLIKYFHEPKSEGTKKKS